MLGLPRLPRQVCAVGVVLAAAIAGVTLTIRPATPLRAAVDPPAKPARPGFARLLGPLGELLPGEGGTVPPPPPAPPEVGPNATDAPAGKLIIRADLAQSWNDGSEEVTLLRGRCRAEQGDTVLTARQMVLWRQPTARNERVVLYLDGDARLERPGQSISEPSLIFTELIADAVTLEVAGGRLTGTKAADDPLYRQAALRRQTSVVAESRVAARPPGLVPVPEPVPPPGGDALPGSTVYNDYDYNPDGYVPPAPDGGVDVITMRPSDGALRRVRIFPRSSIPFDVQSFRSQSIPPEQVLVLSGGVNVLIDGFNELGGDLVDLTADRVVIWTVAAPGGDLQTEQVQTKDTPFTIYLEGNITIRQGDKLVRAERAVYDAREERALAERAELRQFVPQLGTDIRVRAERLRQLSRGRYYAQNAYTTASQFGKPGYRLQAEEIFVEPRYDVNLGALGIGNAVVDPATGMQMVETPWVRSRNNTVFVGDVPVLYAPYLAGPADEPNIPLRSATAGVDRRFGPFIRTQFDLFDLFGQEEPPGVRANLLADYYGKRGPGLGLSGIYEGDDDFFGVPGHHIGSGIIYGVHDDGEDRLGSLRNNIPPDNNNRGRIQLRHQEFLPDTLRLQGELGILSDRNFLEQYFENEFDNGKDQENLLYATQTLAPLGYSNWAYEALGQVRVNDFETSTGWYPRLDLYGFGEPLLDGLVTWSNHTVVGYGDIDAADPYPEPFFTPIAYMPDVQGATLMTRHELDLPLNVGEVNVTPFVLGEAAYWQEGLDGNDVGRLTGSGGVRSSVQFWQVFPNVYSRILGLNGLAHKIRLEGEYRATGTSADLNEVAQYTEIDDNAQERTRYRTPQGIYGSNFLPPGVDPRFYAVRSGTGYRVSSPYYELVNDQQVARLAVRQRLQTKSGPPGRQRIRDWMTLDTGVSLFPNANRDNFGETAGLAFADYGFYISQRTQLTAGALYDFYPNAPEQWYFGINSQRSRRGSIYAGLRHVGAGPLDSTFLIGSYSYVMSPKWISTLAASVDLNNTRNQGQALTLTRVGADFLVHVGINQNRNLDNVGLSFAIEPRFGAIGASNISQLSSLLTPTLNP